MMNLTSQFFKKSSLSPLDLVKIGIIIFVSIHLLGSFVPFYNGADSLVYGISSIGLAEGSWGFTNELLLESGSWDFVPNQWVKTIYNTAIPIGGFGIYGLAAISYLVGGLYGLFYLVPIFTIILLIITERVATKLFGNFVGLFTLVLLSTDATVFNIGRSLLSNNIFAVFFILGVFFLIKFLQESKYRSILLSSAFFATCTLFRLTGLIFFPIEIFSVVGYLAIQKIRQNKRDQIDKNGTLVTNLVFSNLTSKNLIKISAFLLIPWIIFFSFYFIYNDYFFGDPFTSYVEVMPSPTVSDYKKDSITSFLIVDSDRFEWIKYYSVALIPDTSKSYIGNNFSVDVNDPHANWLSIFSFIILASALSISLFNRNNRISVIVILLFVASLPLFFSSTYLHSASYQELLPSPGLADRYMIPILPLFFMISGFIAERIWKLNIDRTISNKSKRVFKILKIIFLIILIIFFVASFLNSPSAQKTISNNFIFQNPQDYSNRYPLDSEGLSENSIIFGGRLRNAVEYNKFIPMYPYWGYWPIFNYNWDTDLIPQQPINTVKKLIGDGYGVYTFKKKGQVDLQYFLYLEEKHGIIQKNFSDTFCKLEIIKNSNEDITEISDSDAICNVYGSTIYSGTNEYIEEP